jgi:phosphatidylinositol glycan class M
MGIVFWKLVEAQRNSLPEDEKAKRGSTIVYVSLMLFNPLVIGMPTRGSNDNIITLLVFLAIYFVLKKQYIIGGILYGLSVHFKIYPIIYCFVFYFFIDMDRKLIAEGKTL